MTQLGWVKPYESSWINPPTGGEVFFAVIVSMFFHVFHFSIIFHSTGAEIVSIHGIGMKLRWRTFADMYTGIDGHRDGSM